jgi:beta-N-acetylhexosaminidase
MVDVAGAELTAAELQRLRDPRVGGVILFTRNYRDRAQLQTLVAQIRSARAAPLLIAVDHEGGRVQRFRNGFSLLPAAATLGTLYARDPGTACRAAFDIGYIMAHELLACGLDFSFAPVLDLEYGRSAVIAGRAFGTAPQVVVDLAGAQVAGLTAAGSAAVGKHFPGHGYVEADSHTDLPIDPRSFGDIAAADLQPFAALAGQLQGVMPAHVVFPRCAPEPAGFSRFWLQDILRARLEYAGAIFSDDLAMAGALGAGAPAQRARSAFAAGCDMVLLCNDPAATDQLLADLGDPDVAIGSARRLARLRARPAPADAALRHTEATARLDALALDGWQAMS